MRVLEASGIKKRFGGVVALSDGNLSARAGCITGLLGANGSGKSTMAKIIAGVHAADEGQVHYDGQRVRYANPHEAKRAGVAVVYQNLSLVGCLPVWQNITLGIERKKGLFLDNGYARRKSRELLEHLLPDLDIECAVEGLSPAEMQIVEVAKALAEDPKLLILDEPTAALELAEVQTLFSHMRRLAQQGVAMVFTSHRLWEVMDICDDVVIFRSGETVAQIDLRSDNISSDTLIGYITGKQHAKADPKELKERQRERAQPKEVVLRAKHLSHENAPRDVSFELRRGEILGIGGLAGQGQRELMLALAGFYRHLKGEIQLHGRQICLTRPAEAIRHSIVLVPGDREAEGLFVKHSVASNLIFPRYALRDQPVFTRRARNREICRSAVSTLSIKAGSLDVPVRTLSGGNQQKVVVGKWLSFDIDVLLLCDPAKGVDVGAKGDLYDHVVELARARHTSVILYASDNEELVDYCDRVMIMYEGCVVETLEGKEVNADHIVERSVSTGGARAGSVML